MHVFSYWKIDVPLIGVANYFRKRFTVFTVLVSDKGNIWYPTA
jgi:hypothetical protein